MALMACTAIAFFSCQKAYTSLTVDLNLYDNFVKANIAEQQVFSIDAATGGAITCNRGSKIVFPPNAFANPDNTITTGSVKITVKEALVKSQWLMEGLSTTTQNGILISGGMLDIAASRSGDGVEVKPSPAMLVPTPSMLNVIQVQVPKINNLPDTMNLFVPGGGVTGSTSIPPSTWAANYFPFGNGVNSYIFQLPQFRWVNCDGLYNQSGPKTTITVTPDLTGVTGATGVQAMLVYRNLTTVITLPPSGTFMQSYTNSIPIGSIADVVCIGKDGAGKIILKVLPATTLSALLNVTIKPTVTDAATVRAYLNSIN